ncbi:hypothetical protein CLV36_101323 [Laceyella sediminis]|uniref:Uncharacterized protein n=2 Tax=Laceyella TaxID=292635 RepID=A0AA46AEK8_9BACL|nr:hypothetical protein CLV36_101323 [Laceyella sediminis]SMP13394.1 hypothetical protein SAMN06265361_102458 [Laceyella tengchongensis]
MIDPPFVMNPLNRQWNHSLLDTARNSVYGSVPGVGQA